MEGADRLTRTLSGGQRRRLELARGVLHEPEVLFLDEPSVGLDVAARALVWSHLRELRERHRTTLFLTTHSMEEAEALAQEVAILDRGAIVAAGSPSALKSELGGDQILVQVERSDGASASAAAVEGVRRVIAEGELLRIVVDEAPRRLAPVVEALRAHGIAEVEFQRPSLEQVFLHHTGRRYAARAEEDVP